MSRRKTTGGKSSEWELRDELAELNADASGREFSSDEAARWNEVNAQVDQYAMRRQRLRDLASDSRHVEGEDGGPVSPRRLPRRDVPPHLAETRDRALSAIDRNAGAMSARAADRLETIVEEDVAGRERGATARYISAIGDPHYNTAFGKLLAEPFSAHLRWTNEEHEAMGRVNTMLDEQRALGIGSAGGNYPVPIVLDPSVMLTSDGALNPFRQIARVEHIVGNTWEGVASAGVTASFDAEAAEVSDDTPTLTQPSANVEMARVFVPFSIEIGQDWGTLQQEMARLISDSKDVLEASKFVTGLGHSSVEPEGLLVGGTAIVTSASTAVFAIGDNYLLTNGLAARWQSRAVVLGHPTTYDTVYRMVGGGSTEPPVLPTRDGAYLGRAKYESTAYTAATATPSSGGTILTIGDFSRFLIADRIGMNVEVIPHLFGSTRRPTGQRGMFAYWRTTSKCLTPSAFLSLKVK